MKQLIYLFLFGAALTLASCGGADTNSKTSAPRIESIPVKVAALAPEAVRTPITASGLFTTNEETMLSFKTGGIVSSVLVDEGDVVQQGQVLATLDLTEINAQVQQANIAFEKAERDLARVEKLYRDSVATLEQLQNARTGRDIAREQLNGARFNERFSEIRAPRSGTVLGKFANAGQLVGPGTPVVRINGGSANDWVLKVAVSDQEWSSIAEGDAAVLSSDAFNGVEVQATVSSKSQGADPMTGTFSVELKPASTKDLPLAVGLFGRAVITPTRSLTVWRVPYGAVLDGDGKDAFVFCTADNQIAVKVPVRIASLGQNEAFVYQGLEGFKSIIVSGSAYLNDQSPIQIIP